MIEEAKQYLIDQEIVSKYGHVNIGNLIIADQIAELLVNFSRIQLQKQHEEVLKIIKDGSK